MNHTRWWILLSFMALAFCSRAGETNSVSAGRTLFLNNCAHCHGHDAHGDEGPDLHGLKKSDAWIAGRIRNGVKGEMTAFGEKFSPSDVASLIAFLRTLR
jgi:mono/diheme cytochrome c family protein